MTGEPTSDDIPDRIWFYSQGSDHINFIVTNGIENWPLKPGMEVPQKDDIVYLGRSAAEEDRRAYVVVRRAFYRDGDIDVLVKPITKE